MDIVFIGVRIFIALYMMAAANFYGSLPLEIPRHRIDCLFLGEWADVALGLLGVLLIILYELWHNILDSAVDDIVGDSVDRSVRVIVDRDDDT